MHFAQEDPMKPSWQIRRTAIARHDGERRWDDVYQCLLRGAMEHDETRGLAPEHKPGGAHGKRPLCSCVDQPSTTNADDCAATGAPPHLCGRASRVASH